MVFYTLWWFEHHPTLPVVVTHHLHPMYCMEASDGPSNLVLARCFTALTAAEWPWFFSPSHLNVYITGRAGRKLSPANKRLLASDCLGKDKGWAWKTIHNSVGYPLPFPMKMLPTHSMGCSIPLYFSLASTHLFSKIHLCGCLLEETVRTYQGRLRS